MIITTIPVILAGGSGTRLWPLSRKNFPKQFLRLQGESSLLQQTMQRVTKLESSQCLVVSNEAHYFLCQEQLQSFVAPRITYLLEPCARNTAPAIASAAFYVAEKMGPDTVLMVLPSDHWIGDEAAWCEAMLAGAAFAKEEKALVTFGIQPTSAKTGYGYIEATKIITPLIYGVDRFCEKPDLPTAEAFVNSGHYYWNSGMFVFRAGVYLKELQEHAADIYEETQHAVRKSKAQHNYIQLDKNNFEHCRSESIDYAVMEKTKHGAVIPISMPWSDLGCWSAVAEANQTDENGNTLQGKVIAKDSHDCLISSEQMLVTTLGIKDQIIVATSDAVLVADKQYSQQVKDIVNTLGKDYAPLVDDHSRVMRPWGFYEVLAEGNTFKVKRLMIKPGAKLSLQSHQHRSEHWVVVAGEAEVVNDDQVLRLSTNQSTYIPKRARHRLGNPGTIPLYVIEVQSGEYLGEDDITRYHDEYHRTITATPEEHARNDA